MPSPSRPDRGAGNRAGGDGVDWLRVVPRALLIAGLTLLVYGPCLRGGFLWDDGFYIPANPLVHTAAGLGAFWFRPGSWIEYYPLQETVEWLQWQMWGSDTLGYHLTNVVLHVLGSLLVWRLFSKLGLRLAWLGGLIFAVHPVQVESVAYISELKNTLSLPLFLLSLIAWIDFERHRSPAAYGRALAFFLLAMLCKISMAPMPVLLLLYAWWQRGRIGRADLRATVPFFLISVVLSLVTLWAGQTFAAAGHSAGSPVPLGGMLSRVDAAGLIASVYFARCLLPVDLVYVYPPWTVDPRSLLQFVPWAAWIGFAGWLWKRRLGWGRPALFGFGFFFLFLAPFLGFIATTYMNFTWVMDHMLYIPIIGLIGLAVAGLDRLLAPAARGRAVGLTVVAALVVLMSLQSYAFAGLFSGPEKFWGYLAGRNPASWLARNNLGTCFAAQRRYPEAAAQFQAAIRLRPGDWQAYDNLGSVLSQLGETREAMARYHQALDLNPRSAQSNSHLGETLLAKGDLAGAEGYFRQALQITPGKESASNDLGMILLRTGRAPGAVAYFRQAIADDPGVAPFYYNLGNALSASGDLPQAAAELAKAVAIDPSQAAIRENLGTCLARLGRLPEAVEQLQAAVRLAPQLGVAHDNLALALAQTGDMAGARAHFQRALEIDPRDADARAYLLKIRQYESQRAAPGAGDGSALPSSPVVPPPAGAGK